MNEISPAEKLRKLAGVLRSLPAGEQFIGHRDVVLCDALEIIADALAEFTGDVKDDVPVLPS